MPPSWKDFKHSLKHGRDDLSLIQLGSHLRIEESLRALESDKGKGKEVGEYSGSNQTQSKNIESAKELWDSLESKPVMEQFNELLRILGQYSQHGLKMDESIFVSSVIDKLPPSWKDFKHSLKHGKDVLSLVQLGSHLRIEESLRTQESDKGKGKE
ncbi:hypothetical protein Tco_0208660, partial [Tanacetum coccineum]